jgi:hypothetical protein
MSYSQDGSTNQPTKKTTKEVTNTTNQPTHRTSKDVVVTPHSQSPPFHPSTPSIPFRRVHPVEAVERRRLQERAAALVRARLGEVFQLANASVDHIPPSVYHFEVIEGVGLGGGAGGGGGRKGKEKGRDWNTDTQTHIRGLGFDSFSCVSPHNKHHRTAQLSHQGQPGGSLRRGQGRDLAAKIRNSNIPALIGHNMGP